MMLAVKAGLIKTETIQVTIAHFTAEKFKRLKIPLPPLPLQQKFAKVVEHVEGLKENVKKTKQNSEELFNSLMSKAFRGEL
jgi:type I restriction enzyme S subunit